MKLRDYINSGILEEFSFGLLDEKKSKQVYLLAKKYPVIKSELDKIQETLFLLDKDATLKPNSSVKTMLFNAIEGPVTKTQTGLTEYFIAASLSALIITSGLSFFFWMKLEDTSDLMESRENQLNHVQEQLTLTEEAYERNLAILGDTSLQRLVLKGLAGYEDYHASAYMGVTKMYVDLSNLPLAPEGMQYQFWAIVNGVPVSAGLFDETAEKQALSEMIIMEHSTAYAISLEPLGGNIVPTPEKIFVLGEV